MLGSTGSRLNNKKPEGSKDQMNSGKPQDQQDSVGFKAPNSIGAIESVRNLLRFNCLMLKHSKLMYLLLQSF